MCVRLTLRKPTSRSTESYVGVNPHERSTEKLKLLLDSSHLEPQDVRLQRHRGADDSE
jgi:hypothetical protein